MKQLLTILGLVLLSSYSYSKEVLLDQLVERDGMYYEVNSTTPFTGSVEDYYDNGQLEYKENYKNGILDGLYEDFYENGQLDERGNYKDGKENGLWEKYYENGELEDRENWKDGEIVE